MAVWGAGITSCVFRILTDVHFFFVVAVDVFCRMCSGVFRGAKIGWCGAEIERKRGGIGWQFSFGIK